MRFKLLIAITLVLLGGVVFQTRGIFRTRIISTKVDLRKAIVAEVPDWTVHDLPIGETEEVKIAAANTLRYDDYLFRSYRRGNTEFTLYVAYWGPGKQPAQMITQHTPDRCWTQSGMTCEEMRFNVPVMVAGKAMWPAQWRKFRTPDGRTIYTLFWFIVGDRPYDFGERFYDMPNPVTFWSEAFRFAAGSQPEQYFFRVTSNQPPESIWSEPGFQQAVSGFLSLGLEQRRAINSD